MKKKHKSSRHHHHHHRSHNSMNDAMIFERHNSRNSGYRNLLITVVACILGVAMLVLVGMSFASCNLGGNDNLSDNTIKSIKEDAKKEQELEKKVVRFDSESAPWFYVDHRNRIYFDADAHEEYYSSKDYKGKLAARETLRIPTYFDDVEVQVINGDTFSIENSYIKKVIISDGIQAIGNGAFSGFKNLTSVSIPTSVNRVMGGAFHGTPWYRAQEAEFVTVGDGVLIKYNGIDSYLSIPKSVKALDCRVFEKTQTAETIDIPSSVTYIGEAVFMNCKAENIQIPKSVTSIANDAFKDSEYIKKYENQNHIVGKGCMISYEIKEDESIIYIPNDAIQLSGLDFEKSGKNLTLFIGENVNSISDFGALGYFRDFKVDVDNPYLSTDNGVLYSKDKTIIYRYPVFADGDRFEMHALTSRISSEAFMDCKLKYILFSDKITQIDDRAFADCKKLIQIRMSDSTVNLGTSVFRDCIALENCELSDKIKIIPHGVFSGCSSLKELYIPDTVVEIKGNVFWNCTALRELRIHERLIRINQKTFKGSNIKFIVDEKNPVYTAVDGKLTLIPEEEEALGEETSSTIKTVE